MLSFLGSDGSSLVGRISRGAIAHGFSKRGLSHETWLGTNVVQQDTSVILTDNLLEMLAKLKEAGGSK